MQLREKRESVLFSRYFSRKFHIVDFFDLLLQTLKSRRASYRRVRPRGRGRTRDGYKSSEEATLGAAVSLKSPLESRFSVSPT